MIDRRNKKRIGKRMKIDRNLEGFDGEIGFDREMEGIGAGLVARCWSYIITVYQRTWQRREKKREM
jgi:hypothetical protein